MTTDVNDSTNIVPKDSLVKLSSTSATSLVSNAAASGKILMVISILCTNEDTANTTNLTVNRYSAAALGGTAYPILNLTPVAPGTPLQLLEHPIFLVEDRSLGATAAVANDHLVQVDYVEFS